VVTLVVEGASAGGDKVDIPGSPLSATRSTDFSYIFGEGSFPTFNGNLKDIVGGIGGWVDL
jgi:hypothetical protein